MDANPSSHTVVNRLSVGPVTHVRISGVIDETFDPRSFSADMVGHVVLDLGRVEQISSFGVRKWIEFVKAVPPSAQGLYVIHAPPVYVDQLNMVEGFAGVATILSILAPYTCTKCREDRMRLVDLRADAAIIGEGQAPPHLCPVCGTELQFADLPNEFFDYARHQHMGTIESIVSKYLSSMQPLTEETGHSLVKLVDKDVTYFRMVSVIKADLNARRLAAGLEGRVVYDFGTVSRIEPEAVPKLIQVLETAAERAEVFAWRVPPLVLEVLSTAGSVLKASLATLWLPAECRNCGSRVSERVSGAEYLRSLGAVEPLERACQVCGGLARFPMLRELQPFLAQARLPEGPFEDFETLEPRVLSQYLGGGLDHGNRGPGPVPTASGEPGIKLQILKRLGHGGMAEVFLARQVGLKGFEKYVVVKKILDNFAESAEFVEMLFAEARANARLTHPNIVQTYDVGTMNGTAYIAMEYVRGPDVKKLLTLLKKSGGVMPIEHAMRIAAETAAGLHYAHSYVDPTGKPHPMVHRDVSPHNILISLDGAVKLSDFGIAKVQGEVEHTMPGTFKGKIAYISPEAISGIPLDGRNDVFALGVTLFEMLTGTLPFRRESEAATLRAIMREPPPDPSKLNPQVPADVAQLIFRALEKEPSRRIATAGQLRDELETAMTQNGLTSSPMSVARYFAEHFPDYSASQPGVEAAGADPSGENARRSVSGSGAPSARPARRSQELMVAPPKRPSEPGKGAEPAADGSGSFTLAEASPETSASVAAAVSSAPPEPKRGSRETLRTELPSPPPRAERPSSPSLPPGSAPAPAKRRSNEGKRPSGAPTAPAPSNALPAAARRPSAVMPSPVSRPAPEPPPSAETWRYVAGGIGIGVLLVLMLVVVRNCAQGRVQVANLGANEQLYVAGVRTDPMALELTEKGSQIVAVGSGGKLLRFGNAALEKGIDAKALVEAPSDFTTRPDLRGTLKVSSEPGDCFVLLGGSPTSVKTPATLSIDVGKELSVQVACQDLPTWSRKVMAVPGQTITLLARPARAGK